jgi:hypothetical protein
MGEAKRRKARLATVTGLPRRLVDAWNCDSDEMEQDIFDEIMVDPKPDAVFDVAIELLPSDDVHDFMSDMFEEAGCLDTVVRTSDGEDVLARLDLFTIVAHGPEDEMEAMTAPGFFDGITRQVRLSGYAHDQANVVLCSVPLDPVSVVRATPAAARRVAEALMATALGSGDQCSAAVEELISEWPRSKLVGVTHMITRLFVGGRLIVDPDNTRRDLFDLPDLSGDEATQSAVVEAHALARAEARDQFLEASTGMLEHANLNLFLDGPHNWTGGIGAIARTRLHSTLSLAAAMAGVSLADADEAHVVMERDVMHVAVSVNGTLIGPVDIALLLAVHCMEEITDWLTENFQVINEYPDVATMTAGRGPTCH